MAASIPGLCVLPAFDCQTVDGINVQLGKYLVHSKNMMKGYNVTDPEQLLALLLHFRGEDFYDIFESIPDIDKAPIAAAEGVPAKDRFVRGTAALMAYSIPRQNTEYQQYEYRHTHQQAPENLDKFVAWLKALAATCDFHNRTKMLKLR